MRNFALGRLHQLKVKHPRLEEMDQDLCCHLNAQAARRMRDLPFHLYHLNDATECAEFATAPGMVEIEAKRFLESGVALVECPDCACTRTLQPRGGILRFKSHDKRKTTTPNTELRWVKRETDWEVVGGERT